MTAPEAAMILGITDGHVRALCIAGKIPATKHGRDWVILNSDLQKVKIHGRRGRPRKGT